MVTMYNASHRWTLSEERGYSKKIANDATLTNVAERLLTNNKHVKSM